MRVKPSRKPPSSTIEIDTAHFVLGGFSLYQAARIFLTSADVEHSLLRMRGCSYDFPAGGTRYGK